MKTWIALPIAAAITLTAIPGFADDRYQKPKPATEAPSPAKEREAAEPSGSPKTGGDEKPSAVDPSQATKTGANAGEGASYNRSNEKGDSTLPKEETDKK